MKTIQKTKELKKLSEVKKLSEFKKLSKLRSLSVISLMSLVSLTSLQAQVRIGQDVEPTKGALLDLASTSAGYIGGLKLPHVRITSMTQIPTGATGFKESITTDDEKMALKGTVVYNTNTNLSAGEGIFYWDGTKWVKQTDSTADLNAWLTTGNSGISSSDNFIGTTNNAALVFKMNNVYSGRLATNIASFGYNALTKAVENSSGVNYSSAFGSNALKDNEATYNTAMGYNALTAHKSGQYNTALGANALAADTASTNNTAIGYAALRNNRANSNTAVGANALLNNTDGIRNAAVGVGALRSNTKDTSNVAVGYRALYNNNGGRGNTAVGDSALGRVTRGNYNTVIGYYAGNNLGTTSSNNIIIGANAEVASGNNRISIGNLIYGTGVTGNGAGNIGIGTNTPSRKFHIVQETPGAIVIDDGTQANGYVLTSNASGVGTWKELPAATEPWCQMGTTNQSTANNQNSYLRGKVAVGTGIFDNAADVNGEVNAAQLTVYGGDAVINGITVGKGKGNQNSNTAVGANALYSNATGYSNIAIGVSALRNNESGQNNLALGNSALFFNKANNNVAIGNNALTRNVNGEANVALGHNAGSNIVSGTKNIVIGYDAQVTSSTSSFQLSIGNLIYGTGATGNGAGSIGIGTNAPSTKLDIDGQIRIRGGVPDVGKVLTSDANGTATWETPITTTAINGLTLNGTVMELGGPLTKTTRISGLTQTSRMIFSGTGVNAFSVDDFTFTVDATNDRIGIGTPAPVQKLHVQGNAYIKDSIGIGTPEPVQKLHVQGNAYITDNEWVGGRIGVKVPQGTTPASAIRVVGSNEDEDDIAIESYGGNSPALIMFKARGTSAAPQNLVADDRIGQLIFAPQENGSFNIWPARIDAFYMGNGKAKIQIGAADIDLNGSVTINGTPYKTLQEEVKSQQSLIEAQQKVIEQLEARLKALETAK